MAAGIKLGEVTGDIPLRELSVTDDMPLGEAADADADVDGVCSLVVSS